MCEDLGGFDGLFEDLEGSGRIWGALIGSWRILKDLGGSGGPKDDLVRYGMIWDDLGGFDRILEDLR